MTTIKVTASNISESLIVRCDLTRAESPVEVNYLNDGKHSPWESTQYQCGNTRHTVKGLTDLGETLLAEALQEPEESLEFVSTVID